LSHCSSFVDLEARVDIHKAVMLNSGCHEG
jgi:hypothetical protein